MNSVKKILVIAVLYSLFFPLINCQFFQNRKGRDGEFDVNILTDAKSVRSRLGDYLTGYLAEYQSNFEKHRIFIDLEILRYRKGETLAVEGNFTDDSVRMSYGEQINGDFPIFHIQRAEPRMREKKLGQ